MGVIGPSSSSMGHALPPAVYLVQQRYGVRVVTSKTNLLPHDLCMLLLGQTNTHRRDMSSSISIWHKRRPESWHMKLISNSGKSSSSEHDWMEATMRTEHW